MEKLNQILDGRLLPTLDRHQPGGVDLEFVCRPCEKLEETEGVQVQVLGQPAVQPNVVGRALSDSGHLRQHITWLRCSHSSQSFGPGRGLFFNQLGCGAFLPFVAVDGENDLVPIASASVEIVFEPTFHNEEFV